MSNGTAVTRSVGVVEGTGTQRTRFGATATVVVNVTPGTYTFYVTASKPAGFTAQPVNIGDNSLTAIFCEVVG